MLEWNNMATANIHLYWTDQSKVNSADIDDAENALEDALSQIGRSSFFDIKRQGSLSGDWDGNSYDFYMDKFKNKINSQQGDCHMLLYHKDPVYGFSFSDSAMAGIAEDLLSSTSAPHAAVNVYLNYYDSTVFQNFVRHEFLHQLIPSEKAPIDSNEHSIGTQYHEGGDLLGTESSPMLTGYTEDIRGGNEKPSQCCGQSEVYTADFHSPEISACAKTVSNDTLDNYY